MTYFGNRFHLSVRLYFYRCTDDVKMCMARATKYAQDILVRVCCSHLDVFSASVRVKTHGKMKSISIFSSSKGEKKLGFYAFIMFEYCN